MSVTNADKVWIIPFAVILLSGALDLAGVDGASIPCTLLALAASAAWSRTALFRSVGRRDFYVGVDGDYRLDGEVVVTCTEVRVRRWFAVQGSSYLLASFLVRLYGVWPLDVLDGAGLREEALAFLSCADIGISVPARDADADVPQPRPLPRPGGVGGSASCGHPERRQDGHPHQEGDLAHSLPVTSAP